MKKIAVLMLVVLNLFVWGTLAADRGSEKRARDIALRADEPAVEDVGTLVVSVDLDEGLWVIGFSGRDGSSGMMRIQRTETDPDEAVELLDVLPDLAAYMEAEAVMMAALDALEADAESNVGSLLGDGGDDTEIACPQGMKCCEAGTCKVACAANQIPYCSNNSNGCIATCRQPKA